MLLTMHWENVVRVHSFQSVINTEVIIGHTVIGIENKNIVNSETLEDGNCITTYGYTLKTAAEYSDIEFRNESNGYYGGECIEIKKGPYSYSDMNSDLVVKTPDGEVSKSPYDLKGPWPILTVEFEVKHRDQIEEMKPYKE